MMKLIVAFRNLAKAYKTADIRAAAALRQSMEQDLLEQFTI